mgnify:CR=1 FL=1
MKLASKYINEIEIFKILYEFIENLNNKDKKIFNVNNKVTFSMTF